MDSQLGRKLVAEFVGTFTLIFIGAGSIVVGSGIVGIAIAHGLAIAIMVSALGAVSGAVFNPALTIGLWATRRLPTIDTIAYIIAQLLGATAAAAVLGVTFPATLRDVANGVPDIAGVTFLQAVGIEAALTFFLMTAVFGTAVDKRAPHVGGFAIGLVLTMDILAAGRLTGAAMNPARAFGPEVVTGHWANAAVYWVGPIIGAVVAALIYHYVFMDDEQRAEAAA